jgi:hypothetical protein
LATEVGPGVGSVAAQTAAVELMTAVDRVLLLDDIWTSTLDAFRDEDAHPTGAELEDLGRIVDVINRAIGEIVERLPEFRLILSSAADEAVGQPLAGLLDQDPEAREAFASIFQEDITEVGPRGASIAAVDYLAHEFGAEQDNLRGKYQRLASGEPPDPDLRPPFRCALYLAKLGATAVAVASTHGLVLIAGVVGGTEQVVTGWKKSRCREFWDSITRGEL